MTTLTEIRHGTHRGKQLARLLNTARQRLNRDPRQGVRWAREAVLGQICEVMGWPRQDACRDPFRVVRRYLDSGHNLTASATPARLIHPLEKGELRLGRDRAMAAIMARLRGMPRQVSMSSRVRSEGL